MNPPLLTLVMEGQRVEPQAEALVEPQGRKVGLDIGI